MRRSAFSLVELSIVLVILGLLVGGILTGQSLIRASELRSVITQQRDIVTAAQTFRDKYFYLPGDMPNATKIWGQAAATNCTTVATTTTATCDGDGNSQLLETVGYNFGSGLSTLYGGEGSHFWKQLSNAGLITGSFDGVNAYNPSRLPKVSWTIMYRGATLGNAMNFEAPQGVQPLIPRDLWNIDTKMDDGKPMTGSVLAYITTTNLDLSNCTTSADPSVLTATYLLDQNTPLCSMQVITQL